MTDRSEPAMLAILSVYILCLFVSSLCLLMAVLATIAPHLKNRDSNPPQPDSPLNQRKPRDHLLHATGLVFGCLGFGALALAIIHDPANLYAGGQATVNYGLLLFHAPAMMAFGHLVIVKRTLHQLRRQSDLGFLEAD